MLERFYRWLGNKIQDSNQNEPVEADEGLSADSYNTIRKGRKIRLHGAISPVAESPRSLSSVAGINFQIYTASGGYVLEFTHYDEKTDRHHRNLHIIGDDADLGSGIAEIITTEMLRR